MNELYYGSHELPDLDDIDYMIGDGIPLQAKLLSFRGAEQRRISNTSTESTLAFSEEVLLEALKRIYSQQFHPLDDIEEHLFEETLRLMLQATDEGMAMSGAEVAKEFRERMDWNTAQWSAFKVHRMQNDIAAQLYDEEGTLKSFDQWAKDVEPMLDHHVNHWLRTEYNTAVIRAQQAADWQRFEEYADVMPNLRWLPSTSAQPGADHKIFWGVTLPIDHPFWNSHRPGDRWGCKCSLENTDDDPTAVPDDPNPKQNRPAHGLDNNPGKDGKLFSDTHPYIAKATPQAKKAVEKYMSEKVDLEKPIKVKVEKEVYKKIMNEATHKAYQWISDNIQEGGYTLEARGEKGLALKVNRSALRSIVDHFNRPEDKRLLPELIQLLPEREWTHDASLGEGKKGDPKVLEANKTKKERRGVETYNYYDISIDGVVWELNCEVYPNGGYEKIYALKRKKKDRK